MTAMTGWGWGVGDGVEVVMSAPTARGLRPPPLVRVSSVTPAAWLPAPALSATDVFYALGLHKHNRGARQREQREQRGEGREEGTAGDGNGNGNGGGEAQAKQMTGRE